jgi:hypothetical protein
MENPGLKLVAFAITTLSAGFAVRSPPKHTIALRPPPADESDQNEWSTGSGRASEAIRKHQATL